MATVPSSLRKIQKDLIRAILQRLKDSMRAILRSLEKVGGASEMEEILAGATSCQTNEMPR